MGYLHHANYPIYFEMGRTELLRQSGIRYRDMEDRKLYYVVAKLAINFKAPARYDDELVLTTRCERFSTCRVDHCYQLRRGDTLIADATTVLCLVNAEGRPTRMPDEWYELLESAGLATP
jgi:acyl-CoA thioester hydrolase